MIERIVSVPFHTLGVILGTGHHKIKEIREASGSNIHIDKINAAATGQSKVTMIGTVEANEKAVDMINNQISRFEAKCDDELGRPSSPFLFVADSLNNPLQSTHPVRSTPRNYLFLQIRLAQSSARTAASSERFEPFRNAE